MTLEAELFLTMLFYCISSLTNKKQITKDNRDLNTNYRTAFILFFLTTKGRPPHVEINVHDYLIEGKLQ